MNSQISAGRSRWCRCCGLILQFTSGEVGVPEAAKYEVSMYPRWTTHAERAEQRGTGTTAPGLILRLTADKAWKHPR